MKAAKAPIKKPKKPAAKKAIKAGKPRRNPLAPERISALLERLAQAYPSAECALHHRNAWELLVATILSAQCTDARVNMVTPALFKKFPTPTDFAHAPLVEIEEQIRSTGFYHNKAKSLNGAARKLTAEYSGKVPQTMEELLDPAGRGAQDGQRGARCGLRQSSRGGGGYPRASASKTSRTYPGYRANPGGEGSDENHPPGPLDRLFPRDDPPRAPGLYRPQTALCRLHPGALVLLQ